MKVVPTTVAIVIGLAACTIVVNPPLPAPSPPLATSEQVPPAARVLDPKAVESGVAKTLTDAYGIRGVGEVKCPSDQPAITGAAFSCTALVDGTSTTVPIKVTTSGGAYEVGRPY